MRPSENRLPLSTVRHELGRWATVVVRCQRGGRSARRLSGAEYERLHSELMKQCYLYLQSDDLGQRHLFEEMFTLLAPWRSLGTLRSTQPQVLASLLPQCQQLEQRLHRMRGRGDRFPWMLTITCLWLVLVAGLLLYAVDSSERRGFGLWTEWRVALLRLQLRATRMSVVEKSAIAAMIAALVGWWMVRSSRQS